MIAPVKIPGTEKATDVATGMIEVLPEAQAQAEAEAETRTIFAVAPAGPVAALFETVGARIVRSDSGRYNDSGP